MKYDKPLTAAFLGILSTLPHEIFTRLLLYLGIGKYSVYNLSTLIVTMNRPDPILGFVVTSVVAGTIAVVLYYSLKKIGTDFIFYKALGAALLSWVFMEAIYVWLIEGPGYVPHRPVSDYYLELAGSTVFGITLGFLFKRYLLSQPGHTYRIRNK